MTLERSRHARRRDVGCLRLVSVLAGAMVAAGGFGDTAIAGGSVVDVLQLSNREPASAASTLMRYDDAVSMTIHTVGLEPGHAYSVWWVIFNNPDACSDECGPDDHPTHAHAYKTGNEPPDPAVNSSVLWATGQIAGGDGSAYFYANLRVGDPPGMVIFGPGLTDPMNADIHLLVRDHGKAIAGKVAEQISTPQGMCPVTKPDPGSAECLDAQVAIHAPF